MSIEAYSAYRRASRRRSSRTPFNPLKSIENELELSGDLDNVNKLDKNELEDVGLKLRNEPFSDHYTVESELGRGKFATVKKCRCNTTGNLFAAKIQRKRRKAKDARNELIHEIKMLALCKIHPAIIGIKEVFETRHEMIIVTDFAAGGELYKYIEETDCGFSEAIAKKLLQQTLEALAFLHMRNIVHMDIKPQNILLTEACVSSEVVLCDLGFSRTVNSGEDVREIVGTPDFVAPEVLNYEPINTSSDMWSVGVLTYMLLTSHSPFAGNDKMETFSNITQGKVDFPEELFHNVTDDARDFITKLLVRNPAKRLSCVECLQHPWLEDVDTVKSDSDDDVNEDKYKNDLATIEECEFEKIHGESDYDESVVKQEMMQEKELEETVQNDDKDHISMKNNVDDNIIATKNNLLSHNCSKNIELSNKHSDLENSTNPLESVKPSVPEISQSKNKNENESYKNSEANIANTKNLLQEVGSCSVESGELKTVKSKASNLLQVENIDEIRSQSYHEDFADHPKALKDLANQRTALRMPSPLSSPIGVRRTLVPSPDTVLENEPFKKHHCRRDSNEVKKLLKSNKQVGKCQILESVESNDCSAVVSKRGSDVIHIRKTPIKTVRPTKSLVTFYENLGHS